MSRSTLAWMTLTAVLALGATAVAKGKTPPGHCRWGGLTGADGQRVRCLTRAEASDLSEESREDEPTAAPAPSKKRLPWVELRTTFQKGQAGGATPRLSKNAIVYARCVADNGGLKRASAEVRIRFHVSRSGRARDVSVSKRRSVAPAAARCIAAAIDGSFVGTPKEQPTVGTAVLRLR